MQQPNDSALTPRWWPPVIAQRRVARPMTGSFLLRVDSVAGSCSTNPRRSAVVAADQVTVRLHRRAHLPIIIDSGMLDSPVSVPWWNGATLRLTA